MRYLLKILAIHIFLCIISFNGLAQDQYYSLNDPAVVHRLDSLAFVFMEETRSATFEDVISYDSQGKFEKASHNLTFGYVRADVWIKLRLTTSQPEKTWYLELPAPYLEHVDFYQGNGKTWEHFESGYFRPHGVRPIQHTGHIIPLNFRTGSGTTVYIKISGSSTKTFPLFAVEKETFLRKTRYEDLGYGIFFGILAVMFFYNLFIYLVLRQTNYLIYIATIVLTILIFSSASGYAGMYLWPDLPVMNYFAGRVSLPLQAVAVALFTIRFLEVRTYSITMYYIVAALFPLSALAGILFSTGWMPSAGNNLISIATVIYMTAGIVCRVRGNENANYFIAAWAVYFVGGLLLTLRNSGVFPYNFATTHFVEIGAAMETVIIAFALAERYRRLRIEKEEAQELTLKLQQDATEKLEAMVTERTNQLSKVNDNLLDTLEMNKVQTKVIEEKNAELDSFFYRISHDLKGPIASLRGLSHLARIDVTDTTALGYLDKQYQQIDRLDLIISGLIDLTRLNQSSPDKTHIDFHKLINECIQSFQALPKFKAIDFRMKIEDELEFFSEWTLLNAIVQNLIENAIKYSGDREPFVRVSVFRANGSLIVEVEDNGQGIHPEHQARIFDMFYRATDTAPGSGLGLYILKRSVDRLKGTIDITSSENQGSTFTVTLPY
jgi:signal transduction histidine kinase